MTDQVGLLRASSRRVVHVEGMAVKMVLCLSQKQSLPAVLDVKFE